MVFEVISEEFSVCRLANASLLDVTAPWCFYANTGEEFSLVCPTGAVPVAALQREDGWKGFRIQGVLEFSLIGVLAEVSRVLAEENIGIFAVSTYNTDYIFVKKAQLEQALAALEKAGHQVQNLC